MKKDITAEDIKFILEYTEETLPKMLGASEGLLMSIICSTVDAYAREHGIDTAELLARILALEVVASELNSEG